MKHSPSTVSNSLLMPSNKAFAICRFSRQIIHKRRLSIRSIRCLFAESRGTLVSPGLPYRWEISSTPAGVDLRCLLGVGTANTPYSFENSNGTGRSYFARTPRNLISSRCEAIWLCVIAPASMAPANYSWQASSYNRCALTREASRSQKGMDNQLRRAR